jgi:flagellar biosynthesis protein FliP
VSFPEAELVVIIVIICLPLPLSLLFASFSRIIIDMRIVRSSDIVVDHDGVKTATFLVE